MKKMAIFSPLPPVRSGISDYILKVAGALRQKYDLTFFVDKSVEVEPAIVGQFKVRKAEGLDATLKELKEFDYVMYHFGNSKYHAYMYDIALNKPGLVVLHDYFLHHLVGHLTLVQNKPEEYLKKVAQWYPDYFDEARYILKNNKVPKFFDYPFNDEVVTSSLGVVVHNQYVADELIKKFGKAVVKVPMICDDNLEKKLDKDVINISCLGYMSLEKRVHVVLPVMKKLLEEFDNIYLNLVGEMDPSLEKLKDWIELQNFGDRVKLVGFCDAGLFNDYLAKSDICINLRYPSAGETSYSLVRAMGVGTACLVSKYKQFDEYPDQTVIKIPLGVDEKKWLYASLKKLIEDQVFREGLAANAKEYVKETASGDVVLEEYGRAIEFVYSAHNRRQAKVVAKESIEKDVVKVLDDLLT